MPQRTLDLVIAVIGVLVLAGLVVLGINVYRAAATGPRWRRRLLGGGLALLSLLGVPACGSNAAEGTGAGATNPAGDLAQAPEWQRLVAAWREAAEVASGRRGDYPFDAEGQRRLLASLAAADGDTAALQKAGLLNDGEAGLLRLDLGDLTRGVQAKRPTEMRMATCYKPMMFQPGAESLNRLNARLPLLRRLSDGGKLQPGVAEKVLISAEADIAALGKKQVLDTVPEAGRPNAQQVRDAAADAVRRLKGAPGEAGAPGASLDRSADWRTIEAAWSAATPLARSGKSTTAQRKEADAGLDAAKEAAQRLVAAGALSTDEAQLLAMEAANLHQDIYREPPTDSRVLCYDMSYMPPARQSLERLAKRLPLVERLAASGKVQPAAATRIIAAMQADLATLADAKELARLPEAERPKAQETVVQASVALQKLLRLVPPPMCYAPPPPPPPKSRSRLDRGERLARIDALEREGKLQPAVAALVREGIERGDDEAGTA